MCKNCGNCKTPGTEIDAADLIKRMSEELAELKSDERMYYETATVFANAPLALIQLGIGTRINLLEKYLGLPISTFPLKKSTK